MTFAIPFILALVLSVGAIGQSSTAKQTQNAKQPQNTKPPAPQKRVEYRTEDQALVRLDTGAIVKANVQEDPSYATTDILYKISETEPGIWTPLTIQVDIGGRCWEYDASVESHFNPHQWQQTLDIGQQKDSEGRFELADAPHCVIAFVKATVLKVGSKTIAEPPEIDFLPRLRALSAQEATDEQNRKRQAAAEQQRLKIACLGVYQVTIDKKLSDLTVRQSEQVQACKVLGFYSPN